MTLGERLEKLRAHRGLSVREIARQLELRGVTKDASVGSVQRWFDDQAFPRLDAAVALAEILGVRLDVLATGSDVPATEGELTRDQQQYLSLIDSLELPKKEVLRRLSGEAARHGGHGPASEKRKG